MKCCNQLEAARKNGHCTFSADWFSVLERTNRLHQIILIYLNWIWNIDFILTRMWACGATFEFWPNIMLFVRLGKPSNQKMKREGRGKGHICLIYFFLEFYVNLLTTKFSEIFHIQGGDWGKENVGKFQPFNFVLFWRLDVGVCITCNTQKIYMDMDGFPSVTVCLQ